MAEFAFLSSLASSYTNVQKENSLKHVHPGRMIHTEPTAVQNLKKNYSDPVRRTHPNYAPGPTFEDHFVPLYGRTAKGPLFNPLEDLRPAKETVLHSDLHGKPMENRNTYNVNAVDMLNDKSFLNDGIRDRVDDVFGGLGKRMNHVNPLHSMGDASGFHDVDAGFSTGKFATKRTWGFHPRERYFREPRPRNEIIDTNFVGPAVVQGLPINSNQKHRIEIGHVRTPFPSEFNIEPLPTAGATSNRMFVPAEEVDLRNVYREAFPYAGNPAVSEMMRPDMRLAHREVIPNKTTQFPLWPLANGNHIPFGPKFENLTPQETIKDTFKGITPSNRVTHAFFPSGNFAGQDAEVALNNSKVLSSTDYVGISFLNKSNPSDVFSLNSSNNQEGSTAFGNRITQKDTGMYMHVDRPPNRTYTFQPQYFIGEGSYNSPVDSKVTPFMLQEIDPSINEPFRNNPYIQGKDGLGN